MCSALLAVKQSRIVQRINEEKKKKQKPKQPRELLQLGHLDFTSGEAIFLPLNTAVSQLGALCPRCLWVGKAEDGMG